MVQVNKITMNMESPETIKRTYGYEYKFKTAKGFYHTLLNFSDIMADRLLPYEPTTYPRTHWIFRGHWNNTWKLLPKTFRGKWYKKFRSQPLGYISMRLRENYPENAKFNKNDYQLISQVRTEHLLLEQFIETANNLGIECNYTDCLHNYRKQIRESMQENNIEEFKKWPSNDNTLSAMTLAQHHGIPTRLLDFTYNPLFAAFFAALEPFEKNIDEEFWNTDLCVWAFEERNISRNSWEKIQVPINRTSNLFAQKGVLILNPSANQRFIDKNRRWPSLIAAKEHGCFIKLTLPQNKCRLLLKRLSLDNITPARIKPNLNEVAKSLEYAEWLRTENNNPPPLDTPRKIL